MDRYTYNITYNQVRLQLRSTARTLQAQEPPRLRPDWTPSWKFSQELFWETLAHPCACSIYGPSFAPDSRLGTYILGELTTKISNFFWLWFFAAGPGQKSAKPKDMQYISYKRNWLILPTKAELKLCPCELRIANDCTWNPIATTRLQAPGTLEDILHTGLAPGEFGDRNCGLLQNDPRNVLIVVNASRSPCSCIRYFQGAWNNVLRDPQVHFPENPENLNAPQDCFELATSCITGVAVRWPPLWRSCWPMLTPHEPNSRWFTGAVSLFCRITYVWSTMESLWLMQDKPWNKHLTCNYHPTAQLSWKHGCNPSDHYLKDYPGNVYYCKRIPWRLKTLEVYATTAWSVPVWQHWCPSLILAHGLSDKSKDLETWNVMGIDFGAFKATWNMPGREEEK